MQREREREEGVSVLKMFCGGVSNGGESLGISSIQIFRPFELRGAFFLYFILFIETTCLDWFNLPNGSQIGVRLLGPVLMYGELKYGKVKHQIKRK